MSDITSNMSLLLGPDRNPIVWWQMLTRGGIIFVYLWVLVRLADRRAFSQISAFDLVIGMILGSTLSRAMTGNAPFFATLLTAGALMLLHVVLAKLALRSAKAGYFLKGREEQLIQGGRLLRDSLMRTSITERDLREALRSQLGRKNLADVKEAYLERNGRISFIV